MTNWLTTPYAVTLHVGDPGTAHAVSTSGTVEHAPGHSLTQVLEAVVYQELLRRKWPMWHPVFVSTFILAGTAHAVDTGLDMSPLACAKRSPLWAED